MQTDLIGARVQVGTMSADGKLWTVRHEATVIQVSLCVVPDSAVSYEVLLLTDDGFLESRRHDHVRVLPTEPEPPTPFLGRQDHTHGLETRKC